MTNVQNVRNVIMNVPQPVSEKKENNIYKINFKAENDQFVRQDKQTRPAILQNQNPQLQMVKLMEQQQKEEKKAKMKQNLNWGIGIASGLAIIAMVGMQFLGGKNAGKAKALGEQIKEIKSEVVKREASEELARHDYERSLYRVADLIQLDKLANTAEKREIANIQAVKEALNKKIIGQTKAKQPVIDFLEAINYDIKNGIVNDKPIIIAIDGPPGTCKSTLMKEAADSLGMYLKKISLNNIEKPGSLVGFERTYSGAKAGAFATGQLEGGTKKVFYMLDELEKSPREVQNTLLSLLDDQAKFKDLYYNCEIDLSQSIFGITTNELERLRGTALYDRIKPFVIKVERYDDATKAAIGRLKLNTALKDNNMVDKVVIKDEIFDIIAKATTDDGGRETTQIAEKKLITELKKQLNYKNKGEKIVVDKEFIENLISQFQI